MRRQIRLYNGSRISGEPLLRNFDEGTEFTASRHEPPYPEREARRIEGGGARDGFSQGSSVYIRWLDGVHARDQERRLGTARERLDCRVAAPKELLDLRRRAISDLEPYDFWRSAAKHRQLSEIVVLRDDQEPTSRCEAPDLLIGRLG